MAQHTEHSKCLINVCPFPFLLFLVTQLLCKGIPRVVAVPLTVSNPRPCGGFWAALHWEHRHMTRTFPNKLMA